MTRLLARSIVLALGLAVLPLGACAPSNQPDVAFDSSAICRFPSGRTCTTGMRCPGEGTTACTTCLCEVTGELSCGTAVCDGGRD